MVVLFGCSFCGGRGCSIFIMTVVQARVIMALAEGENLDAKIFTDQMVLGEEHAEKINTARIHQGCPQILLNCCCWRHVHTMSPQVPAFLQLELLQEAMENNTVVVSLFFI